MTFEEALRSELSTIQELTGKVFPLYAPKETKAPFLVYKKDNVKFRKTLGGTSNKAEGSYVLFVLAENYSKLQQISLEVVNKLLSFQARAIGPLSENNIGAGPLIENITVELGGDEFEYEADLFRANLLLKVNY